MARRPSKDTKPKVAKRNPLLDLPADQMRNTIGVIVWSNKIVVCPRCGKQSRLTLAASLRDDWDLSLTCCPLPVTPRTPPAKKPTSPAADTTPSAPPANAGLPEAAQSPPMSEPQAGEPPVKRSNRKQRRDAAHNPADEQPTDDTDQASAT